MNSINTPKTGQVICCYGLENIVKHYYDRHITRRKLAGGPKRYSLGSFYLCEFAKCSFNPPSLRNRNLILCLPKVIKLKNSNS